MPVLSVKIHSNIIPEFTNFQCFKCFLLVQSLSHVQLFLMPYQDPCSMPGFPVHHQLERKMFSLKGHRASLIAQLVKNPPAMQETWVWSLGWEDPWRRERLPIPVYWPGEFRGLYIPWGLKESDMTE